MAEQLDPKIVEDILYKTIEALKDSKSQVYDIVEVARNEYNTVVLSIAELKQEITHWINEVERLERLFRKVRQELFEVSKQFQKYNEEEKKQVYERADKIRVELTVAREKEKNLRQKRDEQEQSLVRIAGMVEKAEQLVSKVGLVLDYLTGNLAEVTSHLEGIQARYQVGQKIIRMQEEERKRVAREIHDGPAQDLANVVLKAEICEKMYGQGDVKSAFLELSELKAAVKKSLQEVRKIIYNLRPMALDDLGFVPAAKRYLEDVEAQTNLRTRLLVIGKEIRLSSIIEVAVFRMMQEAVNNSKKHAQANEIAVKIEYLNDKINMIIEDDGIGFDLEEMKKRSIDSDHFGLFGMRERVELLDGSWNLRTAPGQGTRINVQIPLKEDKGGDVSGK